MNTLPFSPGRIVYQLYYAPKGKIQKAFKQGLLNTYRIEKSQREMQKAAPFLKQPVHNGIGEALQIVFLTGRKYWYQTAFCAYSLSKHVSCNFHFYDDGSFDKDLSDQVKEQFPNSKIWYKDQIQERLSKALPASKFPFLNYKRGVYPHIKKLTDIHAGSKGWKLVLDSDMLFYSRPDAMINWLKEPRMPIYMQDIEQYYGYSTSLMKSLTRTPIPENVNVGMIGLKSDSINWDKLEFWAKKLEETEGSSYFLEQALTAMLIGDQPGMVVPQHEYIVLPRKEEVLSPQGILHHFVAESKEWYYKEAWKRIIR